MRASYANEVNTMLSFLSTELQVTKVAAFYQNKSIQVAGFSNLMLAFNLVGLQVLSPLHLFLSLHIYKKEIAVASW